MGHTFSGFKSFAILAVANFANINSNEYFCPVGYREPQLQSTRWPHTTGPEPRQLKTPTLRPIPRTQTQNKPPYNQKRAKNEEYNIKNNPGKNIAKSAQM